MTYENNSIIAEVAIKEAGMNVRAGILKESQMREKTIEYFNIIKECCETQASEAQMDLLKEKLETSALEEKPYQHIKLKIHRGMSYIDFTETLKYLNENQQETGMNMGDVHRELDNIEKDERK